ncbi:hypothetical protein GCM10009789_32650 [Kribbella sancticallisti]|uniref:SEC-C motif-containing protein n=2 Tax=Kribbella sancticallisti TaxID=460087 RepID=A0ABP4PA20_9ACTN
MFLGMKDSMADELRAHRIDDRLAGLLDSAQAHLQVHQPERAIAIWEEMIRAGGEEGDWGFLEYADHLLGIGKGEEATAHLVSLMLGRRFSGEPWRLAAELLEERGDLETALLFFSAAVSHLPRARSGEPPWARQVRAGRRRLRWAMGIPLDDNDLLGDIGVSESDDKWFDLLRLMGEPEVVEGRLHFWPRGDFEYAWRLWSAQIAATTADEYYRKIELVLRTHGGGRPVLVPRGVRGWMAGVDAINEVRSMGELRAFASRLDDGRTVEWPPERGQPCWCGSGTAYEECCGQSGALVGAAPG